MAEIYRTADGDPISLEGLCRREPEWAASRLRVCAKRIAALEAGIRAKDLELAEANALVMSHEGRIAELDRKLEFVTADRDAQLERLDDHGIPAADIGTGTVVP